MSDFIVYSHQIKDRQEELEDLMETLPLRLLKEMKKQEDLILQSVQRKYPQCDYFDINIDRLKLNDFLDAQEKIRNSFHQEIGPDVQRKEPTEDEKNAKAWLIETASIALEKAYLKYNQTTPKSKESLYYESLPSRVNPKHYSNSLHSVYIQERSLLMENQKSEILQNELLSNNSYQNDEDPLRTL